MLKAGKAPDTEDIDTTMAKPERSSAKGPGSHDMKNITAAKQTSTRASVIKKTPTTAPKKPAKPPTKANLALVPQVASAEAFGNAELREAAFYADDDVIILNMDVRAAMQHLARAGVIVNCMITSHTFYGQRDYGVDSQIGL